MNRLLDAVALCLAAAAVVARTLFPSEDAFSGSGIPFLWLELLPAPVVGLSRLLEGGNLRFRTVDFVWAAYLAWLAVSASFAASRFPAEMLAWEWLGVASIWLTFRTASGNAALRGAALLVAALTVSNAVVALWQTTVALPQMRRQFERRDPEFMRQVAAMGIAPGTAEEARFRDRLFSKEPYGAFGHPNSLAGLLVLGGSVLAAGAVAGHGMRRWLANVPSTALTGVALILTRSRSAWAACLAVAAGAMGGAARRHWKRIAAALAGIVFIAAAFAFVGVFDRFIVTEAPKSMLYRWEWWQGSWRVFRESPILGVGLGSFGSCYLRYKLPFSSEEIRDPHNFLLELACGAGLPALSGYLVIVALSLHRLARGAGDDASAPIAWGYWLGPILGGVYLLVANSSDAVHIGSIALVGALAALAWGWGGAMPLADASIRRGAAAGVVGLHIHWLAAGGVEYPGLLLPLFAILGAGSAEPDGEKAAGRLGGAVLAGAGLLSLAFFSATVFVPWSSAEQRAASARMGRGGAAELRAAAETMPRDPQRWVELAGWHAGRLDQPNLDSALREYRAAVEAMGKAINLESRSSAHFWLLGQIHEQAAKRGLDETAMNNAALAYQAACERYPNSASRQFRWGQALAALGDQQGARERYIRSLELDATPHPDKRLTESQRAEAKSFTSSSPTGASRP